MIGILTKLHPPDLIRSPEWDEPVSATANAGGFDFMQQWYSFSYDPASWEQLKHQVAVMFFDGKDAPGDISLHPGSNGQTLLCIRNSSEIVPNFHIDGYNFELSTGPDRQHAVA